MPGGDYSILQLGPVVLSGYEIPEQLPFGGPQRLVVNEFVGKNKREIHLLGAQPSPIQWEGSFIYASALDRARFINSLRVLGDALPLTWGDFQFTVVISQFDFKPKGENDIPYSIVCEVVEDKTDPQSILLPSFDTIPDGIALSLGFIKDLLGQLTSFLASVKNVIASIRREINTLVGIGNSLLQDLADVVNIFNQPSEIINGFITDALTMTNTATVLIGQLNVPNLSAASLFTSPGIPGLPNFPGLGATAAKGADPMIPLIEVQSATKALADLLGKLHEPPFVVETTVMGTDLFAVASKFYDGDLDAWAKIADFNNLKTDRIDGPTTLRLPPIGKKIPKRTQVSGSVYEASTYAIPAAESGRR